MFHRGTKLVRPGDIMKARLILRDSFMGKMHRAACRSIKLSQEEGTQTAHNVINNRGGISGQTCPHCGQPFIRTDINYDT